MFTEIQKPTLLLNDRRVIENINRMAQKAKINGVSFRPHFKTHQSAQIGEWFREVDVDTITTSSLDMAHYFVQHGWRDITVAFLANILEIESIKQLANQTNLGLVVESQEVVQFLGEHLATPVNIWLKVDVGYHRTGVIWSDFEEFGTLARQVAEIPHLSLRGLLTHSGHTYNARSNAEIESIYGDTVSKMKAVQERLHAAGLGPVKISIGDTPSCSVVEDLSQVDEIRPGNFVFYDVMQLQIGACREEDIAVAVGCPVIAKYPERNQIVIYGGAVHHSKEFIVEKDRPVFGYVAHLEPAGWGPCLENAYLAKLSQEHGIIAAADDFIDQVTIGDVIAILPVHSCLTVNLMQEYLSQDGNVYPIRSN